jgi:hypothetical protein
MIEARMAFSSMTRIVRSVEVFDMVTPLRSHVIAARRGATPSPGHG